MIFYYHNSNSSGNIPLSHFTADDLFLLILCIDYAVYFLLVWSSPPLPLESFL
jgi:hypothetical protein